MTLGITSESASLDNLYAGQVKTLAVDLKASAGAIAIGQVLQFNTSPDAFEKFSSGSGANAYCVAAEAKDNSASAQKILAVVQGEVNKGALDATAQADGEIVAALLGSGIIPRTAQPA